MIDVRYIKHEIVDDYPDNVRLEALEYSTVKFTLCNNLYNSRILSRSYTASQKLGIIKIS